MAGSTQQATTSTTALEHAADYDCDSGVRRSYPVSHSGWKMSNDNLVKAKIILKVPVQIPSEVPIVNASSVFHLALVIIEDHYSVLECTRYGVHGPEIPLRVFLDQATFRLMLDASYSSSFSSNSSAFYSRIDSP